MDTHTLWAAVDRLVEPTRRKLDREPAETEPWDIGGVLCNVAVYRAATATRGTVPSLWDQASNAVSGGDTDGRGALPARERSITDWELLEHRTAIIETTRLFAVEYGDKPVTGPFHARTEIRHLASLMISRENPDQIPFHAYRIEQWGRVMARLLNQLDEPATRRIRVCCAACGSGMIQVANPDPHALWPDDLLRVWPVRVAHVRLGDGQVAVRGAECDACGWWWWPDDLADAYFERMTA